MADRLLPFEEVLGALRARGLRVGPDDYVKLGKVLAKYDGASPSEVREILVALLSRDERDSASVREAFDTLYKTPNAPEVPEAPNAPEAPAAPNAPEALTPPPSPPSPLPSPSAPSSLWRRLRSRKAALASVALAVGIPLASGIFVLRSRGLPGWGNGRSSSAPAAASIPNTVVASVPVTAASSVSNAAAASVPTTAASVPTTAAASVSAPGAAFGPLLPPPQRQVRLFQNRVQVCKDYLPTHIQVAWPEDGISLMGVSVSLAPLLASYFAVFFLPWLFFTWRRFRRAALEYGRHASRAQMAELEGPRRYRLRLPEGDLRLFRAEGLVAALSERRPGDTSPFEIDPEATVLETIGRGMFPTIVRRPKRLGLTTVLLTEAGPALEPFEARVRALCSALARKGLRPERWYFRGAIAEIASHPAGPYVPSARLAQVWSDAAVIVVGVGHLGWRARTIDETLRVFRPAAWLTPYEDPRNRPPWQRERALQTPIFALSEAGLDELARDLAGGEIGGPVRRRAPAPRANPNDAMRLRAFLGMLSEVTFTLAEYLRSRLLPHAPADVVAAAEPVVTGPRRDEAAAQALTWLRKLDGGRAEGRARALLRELLRASEPANQASAAHLRWRHDIESLKVEEGEVGVASETMHALAQSPLAFEIERSGGRRVAGRAADDERRRFGQDAAEMTLRRLARAAPLGVKLGWVSARLKTLGASIAVLAGALLYSAAQVGLDPSPSQLLDGNVHFLATDDDAVRALCSFQRFEHVLAEEGALTLLTSTLLDRTAQPLVAVEAFRVRRLDEGGWTIQGRRVTAKQASDLELDLYRRRERFQLGSESGLQKLDTGELEVGVWMGAGAALFLGPSDFSSNFRAEPQAVRAKYTPEEIERWINAAVDSRGSLLAYGDILERVLYAAQTPAQRKLAAAWFDYLLRCAECHRQSSEPPGKDPNAGPPLGDLFGATRTLTDGTTVVADASYIRESIVAPGAKVPRGYGPVMPAFEIKEKRDGPRGLTEQELDGLVELLKWFAHPASMPTPPAGSTEVSRIDLPSSSLSSSSSPSPSPSLSSSPSSSSSSSSLRPRVYISIHDEEQRKNVEPLIEALRRAGYTVPDVQKKPTVLARTEVRYFLSDDQPLASRVSDQLKAMGLAGKPADYTKSDFNGRPGHIEVWFSPLPTLASKGL